MKIIIKTKNIKPTDSLTDFINEKFITLKKFTDILKREEKIGKTLAEVFVEVEKETKHHRKGEIFLAEARLNLPGKNLMASARSEDLLDAITKARNELKSEITKYKAKEIESVRRERKQAKKEVNF